MPNRDRLSALALVLALALPGCELTEVATPDAEDFLVVEGVITAGDHRQSILLHRSIVGNLIRGEEGATVTVSSGERGSVTLVEGRIESCAEGLGALLEDSLEVRATCYSARFTAHPGETYELRVDTRDGLTLRGRTTLPGDFQILHPRLPRNPTCALAPGTHLPVVWSTSQGAWAYLSTVGIGGLREGFRGRFDAPDYIQLTGLAVSQSDTTLLLPRDYGVFDRFDAHQQLILALQAGFPAGARAEVIVAAADRNYVNAVRGGSFNPSGSVRVSSVVGDGVGVFGSLVTRRFGVDVGDGLPIPPCSSP